MVKLNKYKLKVNTMINIGTAGTPAKSTLKGLEVVKENNLSAMEVEFVYGVRMKNETAKEIAKENEKYNLTLSVHAPYYVNLASLEEKKKKASVKRILNACERAHFLNAKNVVFHPAFYQSYSKEECFQIVKKEIEKMQNLIKKNKWNVKLAPETTGKHSAFGSLEEIMELKKETNCSMCVDFAHLKARRNGNIDYENIVEKLKDLNYIHCHYSGIEYTEKGEQNHKLTDKKEAKKLLKAMIKHNVDATIISESPNPLGDAKMLNKILEDLK